MHTLEVRTRGEGSGEELTDLATHSGCSLQLRLDADQLNDRGNRIQTYTQLQQETGAQRAHLRTELEGEDMSNE